MRPPRARDGVLTPQVVFCARDREHQRRTEGEGNLRPQRTDKAHSLCNLVRGLVDAELQEFGAANERKYRSVNDPFPDRLHGVCDPVALRA